MSFYGRLSYSIELKVIATLAVLGVFLSWFFNIIDLRQALWVLVGIAGVAAAPTIVAAVFAGG